MIDELHSRQVRLREVGPNGQRRIADATVTLGTDNASAVAAEYLRRSGVGCVHLAENAARNQFTHAALFSHEITRDFACGCWLATASLIDILGFAKE